MVLTQIRLSEQALNESLSTNKIANLAVTTAKIDDLAVTSGKIGPGAVIVDKLSDFRPTDAGVLDVAVAAGTIRNNNVLATYAGSTLTVTDDTTSYIECSAAGAVTSNTVGFTVDRFPIAIVVAALGDITSLTDKRTWATIVNNQTNEGGTIVIRENAASDGLALDGSDLTFTLANTPVVGSEEVYLNGVLQQSGGADYAISGAVVTMTDAPVSTDRVLVSYRY